MFRQIRFAVSAATTALVVVGASLLFVPSAPAKPTQVVRYDPFDASGGVRDPIPVAARRRGANCWVGGLPGRRDTWRCMIRNAVWDPCFESPVRDIAFCPGAPGSRRNVLLLSPSFDREYQNSGNRRSVWAIRTRQQTCFAASGARGQVGGKYPTLYCDRGATAVWGAIDRRRPTWRALVGGSRASTWRWQAVTRAWK